MYQLHFIDTPLGKLAAIFWDENSGKYFVDYQDVREGGLSPVVAFGVEYLIDIALYWHEGRVCLKARWGDKFVDALDTEEAWRNIQGHRPGDVMAKTSSAADKFIAAKLMPTLVADFKARRAERNQAGIASAIDSAERAEEKAKELREEAEEKAKEARGHRARAAALSKAAPTQAAIPGWVAEPVKPAKEAA